MKKIFFKSLAISLLLHLVGFFLFKIEFSPNYNLFSPGSSEVVFIGSILHPLTLGKLSVIQSTKPPSKLHRKKIELMSKSTEPTVVTKRLSSLDIPPKPDIQLDKDRIINMMDEFSFLLPQDFKKLNVVNMPSTVSSGELKGRLIIYKPETSELKDLILLYSNYGIIVLEISVTPTGRVQKVNVVKTSGNPIVDIALKDYFRQCLFEPSPSDKIETAKIRFNLTSGKFDYD